MLCPKNFVLANKKEPTSRWVLFLKGLNVVA